MLSFFFSFKSFHLGAGGVAQVAESLSSKCEVLSSNPKTDKKKFLFKNILECYI
jgi:hypothetical protein